MSKRSVKKARFQVDFILPPGMNLKQAQGLLLMRLARVEGLTDLVAPTAKLISHETVYL